MTTHPLRGLLVALALAALAAPAFAQDVLVVAPKEFHESVADWSRHRASHGVTVAVRDAPADAAGVAALVRSEHGRSEGKLRFVFLLGDVKSVPADHRPVVATKKWESAPTIATDAPYADLDGDDVPDLAIGRYPAATAAEAKDYLARVVAYELDRDPSDWRRRANVIAGTGGFGMVQDMALEQITKKFLVNHVPPGVLVTATYGNTMSAWCPPPEEFEATARERFDEGALVVTYIGHGSPRELDTVKTAKAKFPIFTADDAGRMESRRGAPLAAFIACSTGAFDGAEDSLAEILVRRPRGPIGVIASSRVSTPYSNGILSKEMLDALFAARSATTGEVLLAMKRRLAKAADGDAARAEIEKLAAAFYDPSDEARAADRREHQFLYNLLGDPTVRLQRPADVTLTAPQTAKPGDEIVVTGDAPFAGTGAVEIARRRDAPQKLGSRAKPDAWRATYRAANAKEVAVQSVEFEKGPFRLTLTLPADSPAGPYDVRVHFAGPEGAASGGRTLDVQSTPPPPAPAGDGR